jgi:hypothetical protein
MLRKIILLVGSALILVPCLPGHSQDSPRCKHKDLEDGHVEEWSGRWDSNPRLDLGKVPYYPYTTTARTQKF